MEPKARLAKAIAAYQEEATAICEACPFNATPECREAACTRVLKTVRVIDRLVSLYFKLELLERREALARSRGLALWQRQLPFEARPEHRVEPRREDAGEEMFEEVAGGSAWQEVACATLFGEHGTKKPGKGARLS